MGFIDIDQIAAVSPINGCRLRAPFGQRIMLSYLEMDAGAEIPWHAHPHEQAGILLQGKLQLSIGDDTRIVEPGAMYIIPGGVLHRAVALEQPVLVLDIFSPLREDYARPENSIASQ